MMKWTWIIWGCLLCSATLWGQLPSEYVGQSWSRQPNPGQTTNLHPTPNPMDSSHNWVMTGNVAGGKSFHGTVPYRAAGDLNVNLGSSALDGFIRYSSPVSGSATYYSSRQSATYMAPGTRQTVSPTVPQMPSYQPYQSSTSPSLPYWQDTTAAVELPSMQTVYPSENPSSHNQVVMPGAQQPWEMKTTTPSSSTLLQENRLMETLSPSESTVQVNPNLSVIQNDSESSSASWQNSPLLQGMESVMSANEINQLLATSQSMTRDESQDDSSPVESLKNTESTEPLGSMEILALGAGDTTPDQPMPETPQKSNEEILPLLRQASDYLQQGQPDEALALYQRVAQWRPRDPAVLAGQCMTNLAQGHLMSSALFLSRWLDVEPEALEQSIDLARSLGGADLLEQRIQDLEDYLVISEMAELLFLRAFIGSQTGQLQQAQRDIDRALDLNPQLKGAVTLRSAMGS